MTSQPETQALYLRCMTLLGQQTNNDPSENPFALCADISVHTTISHSPKDYTPITHPSLVLPVVVVIDKVKALQA